MTNDYYCELGDKYYKMKLQVSNDNINWVDANPPEYKKGDFIEEKENNISRMVYGMTTHHKCMQRVNW